jgi:hypothetical protein
MIKQVLGVIGYLIVGFGLPIWLGLLARRRLDWSKGRSVATGVISWVGINLIVGVVVIVAMAM